MRIIHIFQSETIDGSRILRLFIPYSIFLLSLVINVCSHLSIETSFDLVSDQFLNLLNILELGSRSMSKGTCSNGVML